MSRIWKYKESSAADVTPELIAAAGNLPILAKLLAIRGITDPEEARIFLNPQSYQPGGPDTFPDMEKAVNKINQLIQSQDHILIFGDFDVDGITGTSILMQCLKFLGANVSYYIPSRHNEGHGLNSTALCRLVSSRRVKLVITTDTGITNFNEVTLLKSLGVDTIITDHHELPENLPPAFATLNPKLLPEDVPVAHMSGAGVAFKLSEALMQSHNAPQSEIDALLDLVAIGTVVDMVPLLRENRYLVCRGLEVLNRRERVGLKALLLEAGINETAPITAQTLGFGIGPRLNAIGRIGDASDAVELMITKDPEQAKQLAAKLEQLNRRRREMVDECLLQADTHLITTGELTDQKAIILCSRDWNQGIVGLVATRLIDKYNRPCFIGNIDDESQEIRFSARSIDGFNMHENLMELEDMFIKWGGHSGAAGFSIPQGDLQKLKTRLFKLCADRISDSDMVPVTWVDMKLDSSQVNQYLVEIVDKMAPFGQGNPLPIFALERTSIGAQRTMGEDKKHLKLILTTNQPGHHLEAIQWNWGGDTSKLNPKSTYRFAFTVEMNHFNGASKLQLLLKDFQDESLSHIAPPQHQALPAKVIRAIHPDEMTPAVSAEQLIPSDSEFQNLEWIDHRGRDEIESFLSQVLVDVNRENAVHLYRIFCEGNQQHLPIPLMESMFCQRNGQPPENRSQHMILWDLPADMTSFAQLIRTQQPRIVHLIGGKYQKMPIYRPPNAYLDGLYKTLLRLAKQQNQATFNIELGRLAMMLSTSQPVILNGLIVLSRANQIAIKVLPNQEVQVQLQPGDALANFNPVDMLEYIAFKNALDNVHRFREWLMTAPISSIKARLALEALTESSSQHVDERERHAVHLR